jgi:CRP/FNR family transcriptional regulator
MIQSGNMNQEKIPSCLCESLAGGMEISPVCIGNLWVFSNLKAEEIAALSAAAFRKKYERGEPIFLQGASADRMFLIKAGRIKLTRISESGDEMTLDIRKAGDFLGENIFNDEFTYPLTASCVEDVLICGFKKSSFERLVLQYPNIGLQVIKNLARRIDWLTSQAETQLSTNLEERLYKVLVNVAREHGTKGKGWITIAFPLTHDELGFLLGAHRVSITRAMKALKESGKLIQSGRSLRISFAGI